MIRIQAPSRLHFGLLNSLTGDGWANLDGAPAVAGRRFGGIGLVVEKPGLLLRAEPAPKWSAHGPMADRALEFANRFAKSLAPDAVEPHSFQIEQGPPEHCGLGTGTQLGLAVGKALAIACGHSDWNSVEIARRVGRGLRSAIGIHGFDRGGLIVEGGKRRTEEISPLLISESLPPAWRIVVIVPESSPGLHGDAERFAFDRLIKRGESTLTETLCRLIVLGMLPALRERDCHAFGEALYDYNARVGEQFSAAQGGRYASPECTRLVEMIRGHGIAGAGQSSWGPALFAVVEDQAQAERLVRSIEAQRGISARLWITRPSNGVVVTV